MTKLYESAFIYEVILYIDYILSGNITFEERTKFPDRHRTQTGELSKYELHVEQRQTTQKQEEEVRYQERTC